MHHTSVVVFCADSFRVCAYSEVGESVSWDAVKYDVDVVVSVITRLFVPHAKGMSHLMEGDAQLSINK